MTAPVRDLRPSDPLKHVKPSVRSIAAYTLAARQAAVKINQNENPFDLPESLKRRVLERAMMRPWSRYPPFDPRELVQALRTVFGERSGSHPRCALGSVKSMIGHTMPAAGIASMIKAALALHHKILPATINCDEPNAKLELEKTPFYINSETRPWIHGRTDAPRRPGVNAFGFGGINASVVIGRVN